MKKVLSVIVCVLNLAIAFTQEISREGLGTIYKTVVNDSRVNIRTLPTTKSESLGFKNKGDIVYITGCSVNKENIDNYDGYWLRVSLTDRAEEYWNVKNGWIFSKYLDTDGAVEVSTFTVEKVNPSTEQRIMSLDICANRGTSKKIIRVYPSKLPNQEFYTFTWSDDEKEFTYKDPVGTFIWYPSTNEIKHISYLGSSCESAWCLVTNDMKYLFQDYGTGPGPRGLGIFDIESEKLVYSAMYDDSLDYDGSNITIYKVGSDWAISQNRLTAEEIEYVSNFKNKNPLSAQQEEYIRQGLDVKVLIEYRLNLETLKATYRGCRYILTQ